MMLVYGTVASAAARVRQVSADRALEEALAALARELPVVLAGALVAADHALDARRYRKSARDVTALMATGTVAAAAAVANGNGHLLDDVPGSERRRRRRPAVNVRRRRAVLSAPVEYICPSSTTWSRGWVHGACPGRVLAPRREWKAYRCATTARREFVISRSTIIQSLGN